MNSEGARSREAREKEREGGQAGETERYGEGGTRQPSFTEEGKSSKEELIMSSPPKAQKTRVGEEPVIDQHPHLAS